MKVHLFVYALAIPFFFGCNYTSKKNFQLSDSQTTGQKFKKSQDSDFSSYLSNFDCSELPIRINTTNLKPGKLKEFDRKNSNFTDEYSLAFVQIPTSGNFIATITLKKLDSYTPVLTTYDLTGQIIDSKLLSLQHADYLSQNNNREIVSIDANLKICITDTIYQYETEKIQIEGIESDTANEYIIQKKGQILNNGTIEFNKEVCLNEKN